MQVKAEESQIEEAYSWKALLVSVLVLQPESTALDRANLGSNILRWREKSRDLVLLN
jgi:hypothetical protein